MISNLPLEFPTLKFKAQVAVIAKQTTLQLEIALIMTKINKQNFYPNLVSSICTINLGNKRC